MGQHWCTESVYIRDNLDLDFRGALKFRGESCVTSSDTTGAVGWCSMLAYSSGDDKVQYWLKRLGFQLVFKPITLSQDKSCFHSACQACLLKAIFSHHRSFEYIAHWAFYEYERSEGCERKSDLNWVQKGPKWQGRTQGSCFLKAVKAFLVLEWFSTTMGLFKMSSRF